MSPLPAVAGDEPRASSPDCRPDGKSDGAQPGTDGERHGEGPGEMDNLATHEEMTTSA